MCFFNVCLWMCVEKWTVPGMSRYLSCGIPWLRCVTGFPRSPSSPRMTWCTLTALDSNHHSLLLQFQQFQQTSQSLLITKTFPHGYGSIPMNTIFRGMNIHKSQLFWCEQKGYKGFDTLPHHKIIKATSDCSFWEIMDLSIWFFDRSHSNKNFNIKAQFEIGGSTPLITKISYITPGCCFYCGPSFQINTLVNWCLRF